MQKNAHVLVTGASGFLGKTLIPLLEAHGCVVETLGRGTAPFPHLTHHTVDITSEIPTTAVASIDVLVHLASDVAIAKSIGEPTEHIQKNLSMTLHTLEACKQAQRTPLFIYISTDRVYGKANGLVDEQSPVFPVEPYVAAKLMSETAIQTYAYILGMPYLIFRASAFFGPNQPRRSFIADVICKMLEQDSITTGPLQGVKNFTYVGNVADAIVRSLGAESASLNKIYNIGGTPHTMQEILNLSKKIIERTSGRTIMTQIDDSIKLPDKHDIGPFTLSTHAAQTHLGWHETTSLEDGLERTIGYFRTR